MPDSADYEYRYQRYPRSPTDLHFSDCCLLSQITDGSIRLCRGITQTPFHVPIHSSYTYHNLPPSAFDTVSDSCKAFFQWLLSRLSEALHSQTDSSPPASTAFPHASFLYTSGRPATVYPAQNARSLLLLFLSFLSHFLSLLLCCLSQSASRRLSPSVHSCRTHCRSPESDYIFPALLLIFRSLPLSAFSLPDRFFQSCNILILRNNLLPGAFLSDPRPAGYPEPPETAYQNRHTRRRHLRHRHF